AFTRMCAVSLVVAAAAAGCGRNAPQHASIAVTPEKATFDVPLTLDARGLPSNAAATVVLSGRTENKKTLRGVVTARTDAHGELVWMAKQPQVDPKKTVTWGASRGGEASMILASTFPQLVHGAVGYVPSAYVIPSPLDPGKPAWTYHGESLHEYAIPVWQSSGP